MSATRASGSPSWEDWVTMGSTPGNSVDAGLAGGSYITGCFLVEVGRFNCLGEMTDCGGVGETEGSGLILPPSGAPSTATPRCQGEEAKGTREPREFGRNRRTM